MEVKDDRIEKALKGDIDCFLQEFTGNHDQR